MPQKLITGLQSAIFALCAKVADDVSVYGGDVRMYGGDVSMYGGSNDVAGHEAGTWRYSGRRPRRRMMR